MNALRKSRRLLQLRRLASFCAVLSLCLTAPAVYGEQAGSGNAPTSVNVSKNSVSTAKTAAGSEPALLKRLATIHVQSNLVEAPVSVIDPSGNYVQDLDVSDFQILDNGVPQHITRFGLATAPVALVILVQTSQAVEPLLQEVRPLGSMFSGLLVGEKGETAVLCFDSRVRVSQDFSSDPAKLEQTLQYISAGGTGDRLNDGLARAIIMLSDQPATERRVIVVISEGFDRGSETSRAEIIRAATGAGISIYGLRFEPLNVLLKNKQETKPANPVDTNMARPGVPGQPHTPGSTQAYWDTPIDGLPLISDAINAVRSTTHRRDVVDVYSVYTGGIAYAQWDKSQLQNRLQRIALDVNSQYMLAYVPNDLKDPGFHRLEITVREPRLRVRTRAGYFYKAEAKE